MTYTFKTRSQLLKHLEALCQLSSGVLNSSLPLKDFVSEKPYLEKVCKMIKGLSLKSSSHRVYKIYVAFRTTGFESSIIFHHFKKRVSSFHNSLIACYDISYANGYYFVEPINILVNNEH